jgi:hypothetical protein
VTGTFDDWKGSVKLEKKGDVFEKKFELPTVERYLYKVGTTARPPHAHHARPIHPPRDPSRSVQTVRQDLRHRSCAGLRRATA